MPSLLWTRNSRTWAQLPRKPCKFRRSSSGSWETDCAGQNLVEENRRRAQCPFSGELVCPTHRKSSVGFPVCIAEGTRDSEKAGRLGRHCLSLKKTSEAEKPEQEWKWTDRRKVIWVTEDSGRERGEHKSNAETKQFNHSIQILNERKWKDKPSFFPHTSYFWPPISEAPSLTPLPHGGEESLGNLDFGGMDKAKNLPPSETILTSLWAQRSDPTRRGRIEDFEKLLSFNDRLPKKEN